MEIKGPVLRARLVSARGERQTRILPQELRGADITSLLRFHSISSLSTSSPRPRLLIARLHSHHHQRDPSPSPSVFPIGIMSQSKLQTPNSNLNLNLNSEAASKLNTPLRAAPDRRRRRQAPLHTQHQAFHTLNAASTANRLPSTASKRPPPSWTHTIPNTRIQPTKLPACTSNLHPPQASHSYTPPWPHLYIPPHPLSPYSNPS